MADSTTAPQTTAAAAVPNPAPQQPESDVQPAEVDPSSASLPPIHNPNPNPSALPPPPPPPPSSVLLPPPPSIQPSFRPAAPLAPSVSATPQFPPVTYQTPGVPPPGVLMGSGPPPPQVPVNSQQVMGPPFAIPGQPMRYAPPMPNGYPTLPHPVPHGAMPLPVYS